MEQQSKILVQLQSEVRSMEENYEKTRVETNESLMSCRNELEDLEKSVNQSLDNFLEYDLESKMNQLEEMSKKVIIYDEIVVALQTVEKLNLIMYDFFNDLYWFSKRDSIKSELKKAEKSTTLISTGMISLLYDAVFTLQPHEPVAQLKSIYTKCVDSLLELFTDIRKFFES